MWSNSWKRYKKVNRPMHIIFEHKLYKFYEKQIHLFHNSIETDKTRFYSKFFTWFYSLDINLTTFCLQWWLHNVKTPKNVYKLLITFTEFSCKKTFRVVTCFGFRYWIMKPVYCFSKNGIVRWKWHFSKNVCLYHLIVPICNVRLIDMHLLI